MYIGVFSGKKSGVRAYENLSLIAKAKSLYALEESPLPQKIIYENKLKTKTNLASMEYHKDELYPDGIRLAIITTNCKHKRFSRRCMLAYIVVNFTLNPVRYFDL